MFYFIWSLRPWSYVFISWLYLFCFPVILLILGWYFEYQLVVVGCVLLLFQVFYFIILSIFHQFARVYDSPFVVFLASRTSITPSIFQPGCLDLYSTSLSFILSSWILFSHLLFSSLDRLISPCADVCSVLVSSLHSLLHIQQIFSTIRIPFTLCRSKQLLIKQHRETDSAYPAFHFTP